MPLVAPAARARPLLRPSIRTEWLALAAIAAFFAVAALAIGVARDVPVIDDWTYAWSVEQLVEHGRLAMLDWSAVYPVGPALWGGAWSMLFGFSFVTLRISTLALAGVASGALYLILRELEAPRRLALLGALAMAANPAFFLLSSSFMTDVPFVAFTLLALLCYVRASSRDHEAWLWWGGAWACVSCLDRQIGVLTPVAAVPLVLASRPGARVTPRRAAAAIAGTWIAMAVGSYAFSWWLHPTGEMAKLAARLGWLLDVPLTSYATYNLYVLSTVTFYALPVMLAVAGATRAWRMKPLLVAATLVAAMLWAVLGEFPVPLRPSNTWTMRELGGARQLVSGAWPPLQGSWLELALRGAGVVGLTLAVLVLGWPPMRRSATMPRHLAPGDWMRRAVAAAIDAARTPRAPLTVYFIAYLALVNVLWFYNDRYVLVLLPVLIALAAGRPLAAPRLPRLAWAVTAVFAVVAIAGTRDALRFNQAVRDSWQALVDSGVQPSDIDAGYAWTGWVLYAHPENLAKGLTVNDVPWVTSKRQAQYRIAKERLDGYDVAREVAWEDGDVWPAPDRLYVLKRRPGAPPARRPSSGSSE